LIKKTAIELLAIREHSTKELQRKLRQRGYESVLIAQELAQLASEDLQSDVRFTEAYVRMRAQRGYGPLRIQQELLQRGIAEDLIDQFIKPSQAEWFDNLVKVRKKKFGLVYPRDFAEQAKQKRFLQYRGFTLEHIQRVFTNEDD
jgi:regulatory protein